MYLDIPKAMISSYYKHIIKAYILMTIILDYIINNQKES